MGTDRDRRAGGSDPLLDAERTQQPADELSGTMLFNRALAVVLGLLSSAARCGASRRPSARPRSGASAASPSARPAKRAGAGARLAGRRPDRARDAIPSRLTSNSSSRLRVEVQQVLTSPGLIVLTCSRSPSPA